MLVPIFKHRWLSVVISGTIFLSLLQLFYYSYAWLIRPHALPVSFSHYSA